MAEKEFKHLVRIANTDLDGNKPIAFALRKIKGVGFQFANILCGLASVDKAKQTGYLDEAEISKLDGIIKDTSKFNLPSWTLNRRKNYEDNVDKHLITSDLDFTIDNDIKKMKKIKSYRGVRHMFGLPVRGQRTKSNFRRNKGKVTGVKKSKAGKAGK
ncbi:30S ribosomal protein S13 [Candidatus Woesearchaeota archaeon]|nr:30S ribosomal protein S13 [Candidatus Woesearchaeota archaeon]